MNVTKYRKWYLEENWKNNEFIMIEEKVDVPRCFPCPFSINFQISHPRVLSGEAYWITHNKLCVGYELRKNPEIYRPIFSHKRQRLLDRLHKFNEINEEDKGNTIDNPKKFWNIIKSKYFNSLSQIKKLPIDCINHIVMFTSK
jgi:hypothetical protein